MKRAAIALACLLAACSEGASARVTEAGAGPSVTLGTGQLVFEELVGEPPAMELISGPQGGWHLLVATALAGTDGEASTITYEARRTSDDVVLGTVAYRITPRLLRDEGDALVHDDDLLILEIASPEEVVGSELAVSVVLEQSGVVLGQDLRRVVVRDDVEELAGLRAE